MTQTLTPQEVEAMGNMVIDLVPASATFTYTPISVATYAAFEVEDFIEADEHEVYLAALVDAYRNFSPVPPIVLDNWGNVLDGGHRLAAAKRAGRLSITGLQEVSR